MYKSSLLYSSILLSTTAFATINPNQCGVAFDPIKEVIKDASPLYKCDTLNQKQTIFKHTYLDNYQDIVSVLNIPFNKKFFHNEIIKKILNDSYINDYTLTYLIYQEDTLFSNSVISKNKSNHNSYISSVKTGGQHIILYHIPCKSRLNYKKIKKILKNSTKWKDIKKYLKKISKDHEIIVKEMYNKELSLVPTNDLESSFESIANFHKNIAQYAKPYAYIIANEKTVERQNIYKVIHLYNNVNNLRYYKHHRDYFQPMKKQQQIALSHIYQKTKYALNRCNQDFDYITDLNQTKFNYILPPLYRSFIAQKAITLPQKSIVMSIDRKKANLTIINPKQTFTIVLQSKLDIQNRGQLLRMINQINFSTEKQNYKKKDINIIKDTYVDYPGLRFNSINTNYGTLSLNLAFDKYEQYHKANGTGILKSALCGYSIGKNKIMRECKDINYNPIKINFIHEENKREIKRNWQRPTFPHQ